MIRRVAIAGLGSAARTIHIPALRKLEGLEIVGGCDVQSGAGALPFPVFSSLPDMLSAAKPDLLIVATPPNSHLELARAGLEAGCHVFCEKPLAETLDDARELTAAAQRCGRYVFVNSEFPWMPIHAAAKRVLGDAEFGKLQFASLHQTFLVTEDTERGWRGLDVRRTFKEFGTHVLDLACFFFDASPRSLRARMPKPAGPGSPDLLNIIELEFDGDRMALIVLDRLSKGRHRYLDIRLDGEHAAIETSIGGRLRSTLGINAKSRAPFLDVDVALGGRARLYRGERYRTLATAPLDLFADATARLLSESIAAIERGVAPPTALPNAMRTLELLLACYDSAADGQKREFAW